MEALRSWRARGLVQACSNVAGSVGYRSRFRGSGVWAAGPPRDQATQRDQLAHSPDARIIQHSPGCFSPPTFGREARNIGADWRLCWAFRPWPGGAHHPPTHTEMLPDLIDWFNNMLMMASKQASSKEQWKSMTKLSYAIFLCLSRAMAL